MPDEPAIDRTWIAAWDDISARQDRLSRELLLTWAMAGLLVLGLALYVAGGKLGGPGV